MTGRYVLVVDDSKSARYAMRKYLEHLHCTVDAVEGAREAFGYLKQRQPDLIFLDNVMPEMTGLEMLPVLKSDSRTAPIPVIFCTSIETAEFRDQARAQGAVEVLKKPPNINQLAKLIAAVKSTAAVVAPAPVAAAPKPALVEPQAPKQTSMPVVPPVPTKPAANAAVMNVLVPTAPKAVQVVEAKLLADNDSYVSLREQIDQRMRKLTDEVFVQLSELKQQVIHLDTSELTLEEVNTFRDIAREETEHLHDTVQRELEAIRLRIDAISHLQEGEHQRLLQAAREMAAVEARTVAEKAVKEETHRIQEHVVDSIIRALGRDPSKP